MPVQAGNRLLLTSRPYGLDEAGLARIGLPGAPLEPMPGKLQALFIERWFHTLEKPALAAGLRESLNECGQLGRLTENPMLLTALCVIYGNGRRLPEDRYHLYQLIVDNVLHNRYPGDARSRTPIKWQLEVVALGMHQGVDGERATPAPEVSDVEVEHLLRNAKKHNPPPQPCASGCSSVRCSMTLARPTSVGPQSGRARPLGDPRAQARRLSALHGRFRAVRRLRRDAG